MSYPANYNPNLSISWSSPLASLQSLLAGGAQDQWGVQSVVNELAILGPAYANFTAHLPPDPSGTVSASLLGLFNPYPTQPAVDSDYRAGKGTIVDRLSRVVSQANFAIANQPWTGARPPGFVVGWPWE